MSSRFIRKAPTRRPKAGGGFVGSVLRGGGTQRFMQEMLADPELTDALNQAAGTVKQRAQILLRSGGRSGALYQVTRGVYRKASAPGEAPASFTGNLYKGVRVKRASKRQLRKVAKVIGGAPHSHLLEWGTLNMLPRPFMGPAMRASKAGNFIRLKGAALRSVKNAARAAKAQDVV